MSSTSQNATERAGTPPSNHAAEGSSFPPAPDKSDSAEIWRTYVAKAEEHDTALLRRWNEGVGVFLLFTGLFSAILSAFLIASWSTLQSDSGQATVDGLVAISQQLTELSSGRPLNTTTIYRPQTFVAPWWAVAVNGLWFTSLMLSLVTAVLAMLVKEWISAYNENIATLPIERVQQRQFRYDGLIKWSLPTIVSFLPLSIHIAVFLFFVGLAIFTWSVSTTLCVLTSSLLCISLSLYVASAAAPLFLLDCPYKSPLTTVLGHVSESARLLLQHIYCCLHLNIRISQEVGTGYGIGAYAHQSSAIMLQARALAWLSKSSDRKVQEAALYFVARWRAPKPAWADMRQYVHEAALTRVRDNLLFYKSIGHVGPDDSEAMQRLALMSCLFPGQGDGASESGLLNKKYDGGTWWWIWPTAGVVSRIESLCDVIGLNAEERYASLRHLGWSGAPLVQTTEALCIIAEALHHRAEHYPGDWAAVVLSGPFSFIFEALSGSNVPQTCLFKYLCLLGHALSLEELECCSDTDGWTPRYPVAPMSVGFLLLSCAKRLEKVLDPEASLPVAPSPLLSLNTSDRISAARTIHRSLLLCAARNPQLTTRYGHAALIRGTGRKLNLCLKAAAAGDHEMWQAAFGTRAETVSLIVALFGAAGTEHIAKYCPTEALDCLRYLVHVQAEYQAFIDALEGPFHDAWSSRMTSRCPQFVRDGRLKELVHLIGERTVPVILLAIYIAREVLDNHHDPPTKVKSLRQLVSDGWLDCMWEHGIDYLFACHRKYDNANSARWLRDFRLCIEEFVCGNCEEAKARALLERYDEGLKDFKGRHDHTGVELRIAS